MPCGTVIQVDRLIDLEIARDAVRDAVRGGRSRLVADVERIPAQ